MSIAPGSHRKGVVYLEIPELIEQLSNFLPTTLIASLSGVKDAGQVRKWARGELAPTPASAARLRFALDQAQRIASEESVKIATAWLTSANELLAFELPVKAIREDRFKDVADALHAFVDGYSG